MPRAIYLAVFSNGARPAHWSIYVPTSNAKSTGKMIHVTGNTATGFFLEFKRNYDFENEARRYQIIELAQVSDQYVTDTTGNGAATVDTTAHDRLESAATVVQPPERSLNPFDPAAPNCQNWIENYVQKLISDGYIDSSATSVLQTAPKRF